MTIPKTIQFTNEYIASLRAQIDGIMRGPPDCVGDALIDLLQQTARQVFVQTMAHTTPAPAASLEHVCKALAQTLADVHPEDHVAFFQECLGRYLTGLRDAQVGLLIGEAERRERAAATFPECATALTQAAAGYRFAAGLVGGADILGTP